MIHASSWCGRGAGALAAAPPVFPVGKEPILSSLRTITELTARDVMTPEPICAEPHMSIRTLVELLEGAGVSGAPVIDRQGGVIGVVSKSDLLHACLERAEDYEPAYLYELIRGEEDEDVGPASSFSEPDIRVEDFMTDDPITAPPSAPISALAAMMHESRIHRVIIASDDRVPLGIVTSLDLVRVIAERAAPPA